MKPFMRTATRKKRDTVMETALQMFVEQGFENVSVDDIIAEANISKGTFYHYFSRKEDILDEMSGRQLRIIEAWLKQPPAQVTSLESHINKLFFDLSSNIAAYPKLVRSMSFLALQPGDEGELRQREFRVLAESLQHWLPDARKVQLLVTAYLGTLLTWCTQDGADLTAMLQTNLGWAWAGLRADSPAESWAMIKKAREEPFMKVAVIGGGLAGLTAAAYLSDRAAIDGVLFERSPQLGGRAFTYEKAGFTLNYGAHAIYGIDRHTITDLEKELGLSFSSKQVDKRRVMYAKHGQLTEAPLDFINLMKTELLSTRQKVRFVGEITAIIANIHQLKNYATLGDYLAESNADEDVKELWEHLVCSNFFITPEEARKVPGSVISDYYHNLFLSSRPVNYVLGSWAVITNQLKHKLENSGRWSIALQEGVESIRYHNRKFVLQTKSRELEFDRVIFAMPVQQVVKLLKGTAWEPFIAPYESNSATEVMVYDIGLERVVARPFSYISDMDNKMFITDVSATDHTLVPEGGQLLQGVAYLNDNFDNEQERKSYLEQKTNQMEALFDTHYPGWREAVAVKRISKKAMVASVKNVSTNMLLPSRIENVPFYFCGDGCVGKGELAERSFSSARSVAMMIMEDLKVLAAVR